MSNDQPMTSDDFLQKYSYKPHPNQMTNDQCVAEDQPQLSEGEKLSNMIDTELNDQPQYIEDRVRNFWDRFVTEEGTEISIHLKQGEVQDLSKWLRQQFEEINQAGMQEGERKGQGTRPVTDTKRFKELRSELIESNAETMHAVGKYSLEITGIIEVVDWILEQADQE